MNILPLAPLESDLIQKWYMMMKEKLMSPETSLLYMKRIMVTTVSMFLHSRHVFSDDNFTDKQLGDFSFKLLSTKSSNSSVQRLLSLMKSCFDSLDNGFVEQIRFTILTDESAGCEPVEEFGFKFKNADDQLIFEYEEGYEESDVTVPEKTRKSTTETLKKILHFNKNLKPLPKKGKILISVLYNDDITPANYEPNGFRPCDYDRVPFLKNVCAVRYGEVLTPFHRTSMSIKSTLIDENEIFNDEFEQENKTKTSQTSQIFNDEKENGNEVAMQIDEEINSSESMMIHCSCGMKIAQDVMLQCHCCNKLQHGPCYGIVSMKNAPNYHLCVNCYHIMYPVITPATDELLFSKKTNAEREVICLMRQFLLQFLSLDVIDVHELSLFSGLNMTKVNCVLEVMELEKYVTEPNANGLRHVIQETVLSDGLQKYFLFDSKQNLMLKSMNDSCYTNSQSPRAKKCLQSNSQKISSSQESHQVVPDVYVSQTFSGCKSSDDFIPPSRQPAKRKIRASVGNGKAKRRKTSAVKENVKYEAVAHSSSDF